MASLHLIQLQAIVQFNKSLMKRITNFIAILIALIVFSAFNMASDIIERLGTEQRYAREAILNNIIGTNKHEPIDGSISGDGETPEFTIPTMKLLPSIIKGDKPGAARDACQFVKDYINSEEFVREYENVRQKAKPVEEPPRLDAETIAGMKGYVKEMEATIAQFKSSNMNPEYVKEAEQEMAKLKKRIIEESDPTPNNTKWLKAYPENPSIIVKARLEEYLKLVATVDFNAKLTDTGYDKKFINPAYEAKSTKWKAIYRAGKEVNDVTTAFAKEWLKGEIIATNKIKMSEAYPEPKKNVSTSAVAGNGGKEDEQTGNNEVIDEPADIKPKNVLNGLKNKAKKVLD